jgi:hypothetical protein
MTALHDTGELTCPRCGTSLDGIDADVTGVFRETNQPLRTHLECPDPDCNAPLDLVIESALPDALGVDIYVEDRTRTAAISESSREMTRYAAYIRTSTARQTTGKRSQRGAILEWFAERDVTDWDEYVDTARSGADDSREAFRDLLAAVRADEYDDVASDDSIGPEVVGAAMSLV